MVRARAPSQRISTVPVGAAYRNEFEFTPSALATSPSAIRRPSRNACRRAAMSSARFRPAASSGSLPSVNSARSLAGTTYVLNRGPQTWTSDGSSQLDGCAPSTRAWIERSAARGMLSWRPAHAARRSEREPRGSRSSSDPTRRRNARICDREKSSRVLFMDTHNPYLMRAVVHDRYGPPELLHVADVPRPSPNDDEVLVRVRASTVTRADAMGVRGVEYRFTRLFTGIRRPRRTHFGS